MRLCRVTTVGKCVGVDAGGILTEDSPTEDRQDQDHTFVRPRSFHGDRPPDTHPTGRKQQGHPDGKGTTDFRLERLFQDIRPAGSLAASRRGHPKDDRKAIRPASS